MFVEILWIKKKWRKFQQSEQPCNVARRVSFVLIKSQQKFCELKAEFWVLLVGWSEMADRRRIPVTVGVSSIHTDHSSALLSKGTRISVTVIEALKDLIVVSLDHNSKIYQGALLDITNRFVPSFNHSTSMFSLSSLIIQLKLYECNICINFLMNNIA